MLTAGLIFGLIVGLSLMYGGWLLVRSLNGGHKAGKRQRAADSETDRKDDGAAGTKEDHADTSVTMVTNARDHGGSESQKSGRT